MISFTGVAIFTYTYLPTAQAIVFASDPAAVAGGYFSRPPSGQPGDPLVSLDGLRDRAAAHWGGARPNYVQIVHPGDANSYVEMRPRNSRTISFSTEAIWFDAATGRFLAASPTTTTRRSYDFLYGIHLIQFDHWPLRWLYFLSGLAGCVLIATGLLFWVQSRRKQHEKQGLKGGRLVEAAAIAMTAGLLIATLAFFIANRLLPAAVANRESMEMWVFHIVWMLAALHAFTRGRDAWCEQAWLIAGGSMAAVLLNLLTTGHGLPAAVAGGLWHTAGVDLAFLASAAIAAASAVKLRHVARRRGVASARRR